jgi:hypothetical protein
MVRQILRGLLDALAAPHEGVPIDVPPLEYRHGSHPRFRFLLEGFSSFPLDGRIHLSERWQGPLENPRQLMADRPAADMRRLPHLLDHGAGESASEVDVLALFRHDSIITTNVVTMLFFVSRAAPAYRLPAKGLAITLRCPEQR